MTEPTKVCRCGDKCQCRADVPHGCPNARQCECRADAERREAAITRNLAMTYLNTGDRYRRPTRAEIAELEDME